MDTSLAHLPQQKQDDLHRLVALIRDHCPAVQMIILFGSYARGDWKEAKDLAPDRRSGHASDYDILAVTDDEKACGALIWQEIERACMEAGLSAHPRIIHHEIGFVNRKLEKGHYFFSDITKEGKMLYDSGEFPIATARALSDLERLEIARDDFAHWFERVERHYELAQICGSKGWLKDAAFNLHQASEAAFKTVLLLFTGYIPDEHYLCLLGRMVADFEPVFTDVFPSTTEFESEAFKLLDYAYIGARYDKRYTIDEASLDYLMGRVAALVDLTRERCRARIDSLKQAAG